MTNDEHEAQDIAQEAVTRAWRHRASVRCTGNQGAWLAAITRNEARRLYARRVASVPAEQLAQRSGAVGAHDGGVEAMDVRLAIERLDPLDRTIALLRYSEDLTQPRIAELLDMPEGTVKVRLHRLRRKLRASLDSV
jgi:RNA polymerase sigma-70 factor (ECF subfamily)